jgi:hypothetical protein
MMRRPIWYPGLLPPLAQRRLKRVFTFVNLAAGKGPFANPWCPGRVMQAEDLTARDGHNSRPRVGCVRGLRISYQLGRARNTLIRHRFSCRI